MDVTLEPELFRNLSVYQDVVLDGRTVLSGTRDCPRRWEALMPHLPAAGAILDVGSNFGWFGLKISQTRPECVVASVEADERSAAVQRRVLAADSGRRVCLLTSRAGTPLAQRFVRSGQRFDAVLCLSVLHWLPDHREFLTALGTIAGRLLIEQPNPNESGAGVDRVRREIGSIGPYLQALFPDRPVCCVDCWPSHRDPQFTRELWLVAEPAGWQFDPAPGLDVAAMLDSGLSWPPRSWWQEQVEGSVPLLHQSIRPLLTPQGVRLAVDWPADQAATRWRSQIRRLPEHRLFTPGPWLARRVRRTVGDVLRLMRLR